MRVLLALGGSTNAVIHLTAIAGRAGVRVGLEQLNKLSESTPVLVNLKPVGNGYMEDFFSSGGMGALLRELKPLLHLDCMTVTGETLGERLAHDAAPFLSAPQPTQNCSSTKEGRWSSHHSLILPHASTTRISMSIPRMCSFCKTLARTRPNVCPRLAIFRFHESSPNAA